MADNDDRRHDVVTILRAAAVYIDMQDASAFGHAVDDVVERVRDQHGERGVEELVQLLAVTAVNGLNVAATVTQLGVALRDELARGLNPSFVEAVRGSLHAAPVTLEELLDSLEISAITPLHDD